MVREPLRPTPQPDPFAKGFVTGAIFIVGYLGCVVLIKKLMDHGANIRAVEARVEALESLHPVSLLTGPIGTQHFEHKHDGTSPDD